MSLLVVEMINDLITNVAIADGVFVSNNAATVRSSFRWGASFSALFLLILNRLGRQSSLQPSLLVLILITSIPEAIFHSLRGEFGYWVASLAITANYCFSDLFPVSRFLLFVIVPNWLANELRNNYAGAVFCFLLWILIFITQIYGIGGCRRCECNLLCSGYWLSMLLLLFFTILYLCLGPW